MSARAFVGNGLETHREWKSGRVALFSLSPALSHKLKEGGCSRIRALLLDRDNNGCIG